LSRAAIGIRLDGTVMHSLQIVNMLTVYTRIVVKKYTYSGKKVRRSFKNVNS